MNHEEIWKKYTKALEFNEKIRLVDNVEENENFFIGRQWEGVQSNGLPTPVFNFLKQIVQHQVASITSDNIKLAANLLHGSDREMDRAVQVVNGEFAALFEQNRITNLLREYARNAAVDGDGCLFSYWGEDRVETEILENTRVFFGNPNNRRVQKQPYIIVARRSRVEELRDYAREHGCRNIDAIRPDGDDNRSRMDALVDDNCTVLLYLWKDKKTGSVHALECVKDTVIRPQWDMKIRLYPITWLNWDYVQDSYHGQALITGLIHNQQFVNKAYAASMVSLLMSAFPKVVYDRTRVAGWSNQVGAQIGVNGDVNNVARIVEPAQISPQVAQFINSAIENTQNFTGATAVALGNTRPDNTSAIIALQRAASIPAEITRQNLYQSVEELGRIYVEFMAFYYGKRRVDVPVESVLEPEITAFAETPAAQRASVEYDFAQLRTVPMFLKLDVGASAYWSEITSIQTLDNLLQKGLISLTDYLERIPDGYIAKRQELLDKYKAMEASPAEASGEDSAPALPGAMEEILAAQSSGAGLPVG